MLPMVRTRRVFGAATVFVVTACTFPTVEYEATCVVPTTCLNDTEVCRKQADAQQGMCLTKCTMDCATCGTEFDTALSMCVAQCESCSASDGCMNATDSCKALLGVP